MIKPDRGTTPFKELKNGSVDVDVLQTMKELKSMIQFDDPACLLFTSVSPQTGYIHKFEGSFLRGEVRSNGFKAFNGWIVEP